MNKIQNLFATQGFRIADIRKGYTDFSFLSLRIAIQAYAATANDIIHLVSYLGTTYTVEQIDATYSAGYVANCTQAIIHIQHFVELFVKNVLRTIHEALPCNVVDKPAILAKLLGNVTLATEEVAELKTVELAEALTRLSTVIKENLLDVKFHFIKDEIEWMKEVNVLRNRIMHRGVFVLRPQGLDELFGSYIFPFIKKVFATLDFINDEPIWKYKNIACGVDPITEIASMFALRGTYDLKKAILLKQMMLGGYSNPLVTEEEEVLDEPFVGFLDKVPSMNEHLAARAEKNAAGRKAEAAVSEVDKCPVCGVHALVVYEHNVEIMEHVDVDIDYHMTCECCDFSSSHPINLAPIATFLIREYW